MKIILATLFLLIFSASSLAKEPCKEVSGQLISWNGWPPYLRLVTQIKNFGVFDGHQWEIGIYQGDQDKNPEIPEPLIKLLPSPIKGKFTVCDSGKYAKVPYFEKPLPLYKVVSFKNVEYGKLDEAERKMKWIKFNPK